VPTVKKLADEELARQQKLGAQSCRGLLGSPDLGILGGDRHAKRVFDEVLAREKEMSGAWAVFYHSYNTPAIVYEVQAAVARVLFRFSARHGTLPRILMKPFAKIPDAAAAVKTFPTWSDNDHNQQWKSVGISCTTSCVSTDSEPLATPTQAFLRGYQGAPDINVQGKLENLLQDCGWPRQR